MARQIRHASEISLYGSKTPAGVWDEDLDKYQSRSYICDGPEGYKIILRRSTWLSWNGYVKLPSDHPCYNVGHYGFFNRLPEGVPKPPMELTYGSYKERGVFGFDHTWQGRDLMPRWPFAQAPGHTFSTYEMVQEECKMLVSYFQELVNHTEAINAQLKHYYVHYCEQCYEFCTKLTKLVEGKMCCAACESEMRKAELEPPITVADRYNYAKKNTECAISAAGSKAVAAKGDAANAGAIYAAMMAKKKKGKGKGKK
jgi:hypothetical protein